MGCGGSKSLNKNSKGSLKAAGVSLPKQDLTATHPQVLAITALCDQLTALPQWEKMAGNGFERTDKDGSGEIDKSELEITMEEIQKGVLGDLFPDAEVQDVDQEAVEQTLEKYNKDNNPTLNKEEFVVFATEYIKITIKKNAIRYVKTGKDLNPVVERLGKRAKALSEVDVTDL